MLRLGPASPAARAFSIWSLSGTGPASLMPAVSPRTRTVRNAPAAPAAGATTHGSRRSRPLLRNISMANPVSPIPAAKSSVTGRRGLKLSIAA